MILDAGWRECEVAAVAYAETVRMAVMELFKIGRVERVVVLTQIVGFDDRGKVTERWNVPPATRVRKLVLGVECFPEDISLGYWHNLLATWGGILEIGEVKCVVILTNILGLDDKKSEIVESRDIPPLITMRKGKKETVIDDIKVS